MTTKALLDPNDWRNIVSELATNIAEDDLPEKVVRFAEHLISGYTVTEAAKHTKISAQQANIWLTRYPKIAELAVKGREALSSWRMTKLEQQFLQALNRSEDVLNVSLDGKDKFGNDVDPKVLTVVAAQARYIIGLFAGQQKDIHVTHEMGDTVLKAKQDALAYIAERMKENDANSKEEPIEVAYTVINPRMDTNIPLLNESGSANFGTLGVMSITKEGVLCHVCGRRSKHLEHHVRQNHAMTIREYETVYMLPENSVSESYESVKNGDYTDE